MAAERFRTTPAAITQKKGASVITLVSAYDYPIARCADKAGIDILFVSDAFALVGLGRDNVLSVTVDEVVYHTKAVRAGSDNCLVLSALPFLSYTSQEQTLRSAAAIVKEGGADAVELEGGAEIASSVKTLHANGIAVAAHIGLTKQRSARTGTHRIQGVAAARALEIIDDAVALESAGAFALVLECVPDRLAQLITTLVRVPTIGIGSGPYCDGQGLVSQDMLGLYDRFCPRFVKKYGEFGQAIRDSLSEFRTETVERKFPGQEHSKCVGPEWAEDLVAQLKVSTDHRPKELLERISTVLSELKLAHEPEEAISIVTQAGRRTKWKKSVVK